MLFNDDCINVLKGLEKESVDMIYLDPPFFTQRKQVLTDSEGKKYEFDDTWNSREEYLTTTNIDQILQERERSEAGKAVYKKDENGDIVTGKAKKGVPLSDVW